MRRTKKSRLIDSLSFTSGRGILLTRACEVKIVLKECIHRAKIGAIAGLSIVGDSPTMVGVEGVNTVGSQIRG